MTEKIILLKPIKENPSEWDGIESKIKELFKKEIYYPLIRELGLEKKTLTNSIDSLGDALRSGRVTFSRGRFSGRFNSSISKELKLLGAVWDRKQGSWKLPHASLPEDIKALVATSDFHFQQKLENIDAKLAKILPEEISGKLEVSKFFDATLWKMDKSFKESVKGITIASDLTIEQRKKISSEWQKNMQLWVQDFTEKEIKTLRKDVQASAFSGNRRESLIASIQKSYGVSENKAKFLARQETSLLMTKYQETRYQSAGIMEYKWDCVAGTKNHPVRPRHKALADASKRGKIYRWDDPPITTEPGEPERRNNPKQDYNCRCTAIPVIRFK